MFGSLGSTTTRKFKVIASNKGTANPLSNLSGKYTFVSNHFISERRSLIYNCRLRSLTAENNYSSKRIVRSEFVEDGEEMGLLCYKKYLRYHQRPLV